MTGSVLKFFEPGPISIREDNLLRMQGYRQPEAVRRAIRKAATAAARLAETLVKPEVHYQLLEVRNCRGGLLELENGSRFRCAAFPKYLSECQHIVAFIQTLGQPFDDRITRMMEQDDLLGVLFLDNAGWLAIEATSKNFVQYLKKEVRPASHRLTRRLGPGYSYRSNKVVSQWDLTEQAVLFELFKDQSIPVTMLKDSCAMLPRMSRSGIYGLQAPSQ